MGRRSITKKLTYDAQVVAFQIVRKDVCAQLQSLATLYGLAGLSATIISECEQSLFTFAVGRMDASRVFQSMYCLRYYKLLAYCLFGLAPPQYTQFILGPRDNSSPDRAYFLKQAKQIIQFGPKAVPLEDSEHNEKQKENLYETVVKQLDEACTEDGTDEFTQTCRKCKSNKFVEFAAKQTRSADEGMTIEYTCTKCNVKWR